MEPHPCGSPSRGERGSNFLQKGPRLLPTPSHYLSAGPFSLSLTLPLSPPFVPIYEHRTVAKEEVLVHAGGHLHILSLSKRNSGDKVNDRNAM